MRLNPRRSDREIIIVFGPDGVISALEFLEFDIQYICRWKHKSNLMTLDYLGPVILTKFKDRFESYFIDINENGVNMRFFKNYKIKMDMTDLQDICMWRTFEIMILAFPQTVRFGNQVVNTLRLLKVGGKDIILKSHYIPQDDRVTAVICQERSRFLLTSNKDGLLRRFYIKGDKELVVFKKDEWNLEKDGVSFLKENFLKRGIYVGTDYGEVLIVQYNMKAILQEVKYTFPIHWICERNFDVRKVQILVTGPKPTKLEVFSVNKITYKKAFEMPTKLRSEDNPYLKMVMLEGSEEDIDSEMGKEFSKKATYKRKRVDELPPKPPTFEEILEYIYIIIF